MLSSKMFEIFWNHKNLELDLNLSIRPWPIIIYFLEYDKTAADVPNEKRKCCFRKSNEKIVIQMLGETQSD